MRARQPLYCLLNSYLFCDGIPVLPRAVRLQQPQLLRRLQKHIGWGRYHVDTCVIGRSVGRSFDVENKKNQLFGRSVGVEKKKKKNQSVDMCVKKIIIR